MEQTNLNIGTIGQKLKNARLARNETISEVAAKTRILAKVIETMEADEFDAISAPVYAKGFLKLYAQYLGLDPNPLIDEYNQLYSNKAKPLLTKEMEQSFRHSEPVNSAASSGKKTDTGNEVSSLTRIFRLLKIASPIGVFAGIAVMIIIILLVGLSRCTRGKAPETVFRAERQLLFEKPPDVYLVKPGEVEIKPSE